MSGVRDVEVPIRYGRKSRDGAYTMVIDNLIKENGIAKLVPLARPIEKWEDLKREVNRLSEAEDSGSRFLKVNRQGDLWCICTILFRRKLDETIERKYFEKWLKALKESENGYVQFRKEFKSYSIRENGSLKISWPTNAAGYDFIIATSTMPELLSKLSVEEIASNVSQRNYFFENIGRGIRTFEDELIIAEMIYDWPQSDEVKAEIIKYVIWASEYYATCEDYYKSLNFKDAVKKAGEAYVPPNTRNCLGTKSSFASHQRRIGKKQCAQSAEELLREDRLRRLQRATSFDAIFAVTEEIKKGFDGLGDLWSYDTAQRIAMNKGIKPDVVYLQSGARQGAIKIIERNELRRRRTLNTEKFPDFLKKFPPFLIENLLCVGKRKQWF